jgi:hypothetical protein
VDDLVGRGRFLALFELVDAAPPSHVGAQVLARVATPERVRELAEQDTLPLPLLERLCRHLGLAAVEPLLDAYEAGRHQRHIADLLPQLGEDAAAMAMARLDGARTATLRALLPLLLRFERLPDGWRRHGLLRDHPDADVRREALRLELRVPAWRDDAVHLALVDTDERVVRAAIGASMHACPAAAIPTLMRRADDVELPDEIRVGAVRVLAQRRDPEVRDWLVARVATHAGLLRRRRLGPRTPDMLASLQALGGAWGTDPVAAEVLELARASSDADVRAAVTSRARRTTGAGMAAVPDPGTSARPDAEPPRTEPLA